MMVLPILNDHKQESTVLILEEGMGSMIEEWDQDSP